MNSKVYIIKPYNKYNVAHSQVSRFYINLIYIIMNIVLVKLIYSGANQLWLAR